MMIVPDFVNGVEGGQVVVDVNVGHVRLQLELLSWHQEGLVDEGVRLNRVGVSGREHLHPGLLCVISNIKVGPFYKCKQLILFFCETVEISKQGP
jgi:hypothetical protein